MASYGMLRRVDLVRTDVSVELSASFIRVTKISELGKLAVTSNRRRLVPTRATRRNIPEVDILHSHRHENLTSYKIKARTICTFMQIGLRDVGRYNAKSSEGRHTRRIGML
jgi:hypothetical protein